MPLTRKQRDTVILLAAGYDRQDVAERLDVSLEAIKTRLATAFRANGARNLPHLLALALLDGAIRPADLAHAKDRRLP